MGPNWVRIEFGPIKTQIFRAQPSTGYDLRTEAREKSGLTSWYSESGTAVAAPAPAADSLLLAGTSDSPLGGYSYVGAPIPLGQGNLGQGWFLRQWLDRLTYHCNGFAPACGCRTPLFLVPMIRATSIEARTPSGARGRLSAARAGLRFEIQPV